MLGKTESRIVSAFPEKEAAAILAWIETFFPFQRQWLLDSRQFAALNKCRQIGGSHTFSAWAVFWGLLGENCVMVSRSERDAIDLLDKARCHAEVLFALGCSWAEIKSRSMLEIRLASGAVIRATSSKAAGRGFSGNVVLDEFAYHDDAAKVWDAALAATTHGFSCRICSTPNGVGNIWHQLCTDIGHSDADNDKGWLVYLTTIDDAIKDGMRLDMDKAWDLARHDPRVFDQLFRGVFLDSEMQYIPSALLSRQCTSLPVDPYGECYAGIDIGESRDKTVMIVLQGHRWMWRVKHIEVHDKTDDELLQKMIREAFGAHGCTRVAIDSTGMGSFPAKKARREHGPKLETVEFTSKSKEAMATQLYQAFEDAGIEIPMSGHELRDDIASIRRIVTDAGNVRFDAPRTSKGHADRAWALMLALHVAGKLNHADAYANLRRSRMMG